jgi:hypothetical protein
VKLKARIATMFGTPGSSQVDSGRVVVPSSLGSSEGTGARPGRGIRSTLALFALVIFAFAASAAPASAAAPTVVMGTVSNPSYASAHVTGEVNAHGFARWFFQVSTDQVNWTNAAEAFSFGSELEPIEADLSGLKGGTKYYVRLGATNFQQETFSAGPNPEFETLPVDPPAVLSIEDATDVSYTTASAAGEVERPTNPNPAFDAICNFEYVTEAQFTASGFEGASQAPCESENPTTHENQNPIVTPGANPVTANITFLQPGTTYHLRLSVSNAGGSDSEEAEHTFTTLTVASPTVSIDPVTAFTDTTAHFSGTINPNAPVADPAFDVYWHFQCTPECPELTVAPSSAANPIPADNANHTVEVDAKGLQPNLSYQVELVAENAAGPVSDATTFKTAAVSPYVETMPAFALEGGTEAVLAGKVNPNNATTHYWFEYGTTTSYGSKAPLPLPPGGDAGSGGETVFVTTTVSGLAPGTTYHFRIRAENFSGVPNGGDLTFETLPPAAGQVDCPNAKLRAETSSAALPECRAYEMASAPLKGPGDAFPVVASSPDGNRVGYLSSSGFGDSQANETVNTFQGERTASGWTTHYMDPPVGSPNMSINGGYQGAEFNSDLTESILPLVRNGGEPDVANVVVTKLDGSTVWVTAPTVPGATPEDKAYSGRSDDGSKIFFESKEEFVPGVSGHEQIWEWENGEVRLVSVDPNTNQAFADDASVGDGTDGVAGSSFIGLQQPTAVSTDGSRVFFGIGNSIVQGVYVRENGEVTRTLSLSQRTGSVGEFDNEAHFSAAAADGSIAYIRSRTQLTDDATPEGAPEGGLYSYNLETDALHFIGAGHLAGLSGDGTQVYFVSPQRLIPGKGLANGPNLYVANDEGGELAFVGATDSKGTATFDGSHFVFGSSQRLTAFDNAGHNEIYLYDRAEGSLRCLSCAPDGHVPSGDAALHSLLEPGNPRRITSDGSMVPFQTSDPLLPEDVNGVTDVYLWNQGRISLISTGASKYESEIGDSTPDGRDIFFVTRDSLVGQDIDKGAADVYDARVEGGIPAPVKPEPCEGENCQRTAGAAPVFVSPGTAVLSGRGNTSHRKKHKPCKRHAGKRHSKCGHKKHRGGKHHKKPATKSGRVK